MKFSTRTKFLSLLFVGVLVCMGCVQNSYGMHDGYYSAEERSFDAEGWKEFITIYVSNNKIVTVDYNAKNTSGFIKSWDMDYMRSMKKTLGTYPNRYSRIYAAELLNKQNPSEVRAISQAQHSHRVFQQLANAAISQAKAGDKRIAFVDTTKI